MPGLTVSDIFLRVQRLFGDEAAIQVTEDDIIRWVNDAQREAVMQHEGLLVGEGFTNLIAGTAEYALPSDCFTLRFVSVKDTPSSSFYALRWTPEQALNEYASGWDGNSAATGAPQVYVKRRTDSVVIYPTPTVSVTNGVKFTYSRYSKDLTTTTEAIDLPNYYHSYVEHFCMMKAYEMDEDWESADKKATLIQSTLDFNNNRESWFGRDTYPSVTPMPEDYE